MQSVSLLREVHSYQLPAVANDDYGTISVQKKCCIKYKKMYKNKTPAALIQAWLEAHLSSVFNITVLCCPITIQHGSFCSKYVDLSDTLNQWCI